VRVAAISPVLAGAGLRKEGTRRLGLCLVPGRRATLLALPLARRRAALSLVQVWASLLVTFSSVLVVVTHTFAGFTLC
jgi:hypothetical protein